MRRSGTLWEVLRLPRPQRYLWELADDLCSGRSVVLFLPGHVAAEDVILAVEEHCRDRARMESVYVSRSARWPEEWLMERFHVEGDPWADTALEAIRRAPGLPPILILRDLDSLPDEVLAQWSRLIADWAAHNRRPDLSPSERKAIFAVVSEPRAVGVLAQLGDDVFLRKAWYWGWVTSRELRVVAAEYLRERHYDEVAQLWGESVWATLAGADWNCFLWLARRATVEMPLDQLFELLRAYGRERMPWAGDDPADDPLLQLDLQESELEASLISGVGGSFGGSLRVEPASLEPSLDERPLWLAGLWDWHDEGKRGWHSAALEVAGRRQSLDHRVWRGQAAVLLPMIDQIRIALSELLARRDSSWPEYRDKREARFGGGHGKTAAELWTIESFLEGHTFDPGLRRLGPTVEAIRLIRNSLAHYRPVEWADFEKVCKIYASMRR